MAPCHRRQPQPQTPASAPQPAAIVQILDWPEGTVEDGSTVLAERDRLDRAFDGLPADQRIALALHYALDLSVPQVAAPCRSRWDRQVAHPRRRGAAAGGIGRGGQAVSDEAHP